MRNDCLGDRMKSYENCYRLYIPKRTPIIIRLDGCHWHTFTKGFKKPFDDILMRAMWETATELCEKIEGVKLAYTQSDEISLLITNNDTWETQPWFGNNLQKMVSVAASIATLAFNRAFWHEVNMLNNDYLNMEDTKHLNTYYYAVEKGATFDARAFILPEDEVVNYFWWRQLDATRNSIQMAAQYYFSHNELQGLNCNELQNKLLTEKNINWNDYPVSYKRGSCIIKKDTKVLVNVNFNYDFNKEPEFTEVMRKRWTIDQNIPIFSQEREYIEEVMPHV